jgi:hypothetical protein
MAGATNADMYIPVGIEEPVRESGLPREQRARPTQQASFGVNELETVRNGAKMTLRGLLAFQWASVFMALAQYAALAAAAALAGALFTAGPAAATQGSMNGGVLAIVGWIAGSLAFILCFIAGWYALAGIRASHIGRGELGVLQKREVERAEAYFWRGVISLMAGGAATVVIAMQEPTYARNATFLYALPIALGVAVVTGIVASSSFGAFFSRYLRNLAPGSSKKSRRRFRLLFVLAWALPVAFAVGGVAAVAMANDYDCYFRNGQDCGGQIWTLSSPGYGPPFFLMGKLVYEQYAAFYTAFALIAGGLVLSRVFGIMCIASYRKQLRTAELVLRARIRANAPPEGPPG